MESPADEQKFMDGHSAIQKVGGRYRRCTESWQKMTEGDAATRKIDSRSRERTESW